MQRAASISNFKLDFNPREAQVGHSSIDKLPIKKSFSSKSITQLSQISQNQQRTVIQSQKYNIDMLKRINQSLQRQNAYLKKQLDFFAQACTSRRASLNNIIVPVGSKKKQESGYKQKILNRLDSKIDKNDTQSTGLFNSKMSNSNSGRISEQAQQNISDIYSRYSTKKQLPKMQTIKNLTNLFMESVKQNYHKLKIMIDEMNCRKQGEKLPKQTNDIINTLQMVILHSRNPKVVKNIIKQKQRQKQGGKNNKTASKEERIQEILLQFSLTSDLISLFQSLVRMGIKNAKFISHLKTSSINFGRLIKKIAEK